MHILIAKKDMKDTKSAASKTVLEMTGFFTKLGHKVAVISETTHKKAIKSAGGTPVKTIRWPISGYFRRKFYQRQVEIWIKKNKPDVVIGHGDIIAQDVLFMHNCIHLAHEQLYRASLPKNNEVGKIHREILSKGRYGLVVCNSYLMKDDFAKRYAIAAEKTEVIFPAVNLDSFQASEAERRQIREKYRNRYDIADDDVVVGLITSGDFKKRNVAGLIKAFAKVARKFSQAKLFIAGKDNAAPYMALAKNLKVADKVIFAPSIADVKAYYFMIDIFILPAHLEEFGRTVLEAIYCGLPVIVSKYVGGSDVLEGEARKYILPDLFVDTIASAMEEMIANPGLRKKAAQATRFDVDKYSAMAVYEKLHSIMQEKNMI